MAHSPGVVNRRTPPTLAAAVAAAVLWNTPTGCKNPRPNKKDPCQALVKRQLRCLDRDSARKSGRRENAELEGAILEGRAAVQRCRRWRRAHPDLFRKLRGCLKTADCQALETCFQDLYTIYRARKDLQELEKDRPNGQDVKSIPLACRDDYTRGRLRRIGTPEAKELARRIEEHCVKKSTMVLASAGKKLDRMVEAGSLARLTDLCILARQMVSPKKTDPAHGGIALPARLTRRAAALDRLCKGRHHIQRVLNRLTRIRRLMGKRTLHGLLKTCRGHGRLSDRLVQMGEPPLMRLAQKFQRACRYKVPLEWVLARMLAKRRPGKITCRMSSEMTRNLEARFPDDPVVHVASALVTRRCARLR